ncbi:Homeodomain-like protein, partial [Thelephora terrestris]
SFADTFEANGRSICWRSVAAALPGRNNKSCRKRWIHSLNPGLRKGRWTPAEDLSLTEAVKVHGKHWFQVARMLDNGRTDDQCAKRWREALDPNIKRGPWAEHEDDKLIAMFRVHGRKWNDIAASLDGRPPVQCRNRWLSLVRAGRIEDGPAARSELHENPFYRLPVHGPEVCSGLL